MGFDVGKELVAVGIFGGAISRNMARPRILLNFGRVVVVVFLVVVLAVVPFAVRALWLAKSSFGIKVTIS